MPCRDYPPVNDDPRAGTPTVQERLDTATRLLCEVCGKLEKWGLPSTVVSQELHNWYTNHKAADLQRILREENEKLKQQQKRDALSKLTPEEQQLLGIRP